MIERAERERIEAAHRDGKLIEVYRNGKWHVVAGVPVWNWDRFDYRIKGENMRTKDEAIAVVARNLLHIETLEVRNRDGLDFHDCFVGSIKDALEAAYEHGRQAGKAEAERA